MKRNEIRVNDRVAFAGNPKHRGTVATVENGTALVLWDHMAPSICPLADLDLVTE